MFALEVELLTGRYVATEYNDRSRAEWPPHPARLFSALVATHFDRPEPEADERAALSWLECQPPPEIHASEAQRREVATVFVPVNDTSVLSREHTVMETAQEKLDAARTALRQAEAKGDKKALKSARSALAKAEKAMAQVQAKLQERPSGKAGDGVIKEAASLLPERRNRQPRTFPSVHPDHPTVTFVWPGAEPDATQRCAIDRLSSRVVRLGHSSSLVRVRVVDDPPAPNHFPDADGDTVLRVPGEGQLDRLQDHFARHQEVAPRVMPASYQLYRRGERGSEAPVPVPVMSDDWIVLARVGGPRLPSSRAADVASSVRNALMKHGAQPVPEILSGHRPDGPPSETPHLAVLPLPFVGRRHADGAILGVALVLPREAPPEDRSAVFAAVGAWEAAQPDPEHLVLPVLLGASGVIELQVQAEPSRLSTLREPTWCRAARRWVSVTPVALDKNPGDLRARDPGRAAAAAREARATIAEACRRIGLPTPRSVVVIPHAGLAATEKAKRFSPFPRDASRTRRVLTHAIIEFEEPVRGPLLIGAGRYLGVGLFRPGDGDGSGTD